MSAGAGWDRARWAALADGLLLAARPYASPDRARITLPGGPGGYGRDVDGLEGFARTFLAAGFRLAGERGADPLGLAQWYADGIAAGTDPHHPHRWVRLDEHGQAKVEAASIALVLDLTRPWLWDRLAPRVQEQVVDYLAPAVGDDTYPRINWVWFRLVVQTFLRSVGGPHSLEEMREDLATHDGFVRGDGWLADGDARAFDHYVGWALHLYPTLWGRMAGARDLAADRRAADTALLDRYLQDAVHLVGGDGSPLVQGRSLVYRFAAAAPFWVGAVAQVPTVAPGTLRRCASAVVDHFTAHGVPDGRGLLTLGWHGPWPALAQTYSGPGSPYWASKGLLGLALPADHPVWTADDAPLPGAAADDLRAVRPAGWLVSGTHTDGVVRVVNHGVDHARPGDRVGDSPLYARLGYSTATAPLLDPASWSDPVDQSVVLADAAGARTHRAGFTTLALRAPRTVDATGTDVPAGSAALAGASRAAAHWLAPSPGSASAGHGYGAAGTARDAGTVTVVSLVRGAWEVRLVRVARAVPEAVELQVGGWPLAADDAPVATRSDDGVEVTAGTATSLLAVPGPPAGTPVTTSVVRREDASPLGRHAAVPVVSAPAHRLPDDVVPGWFVVAVGLVGRPAGDAAHPAPRVAREGVGGVAVTWADGARTTLTLPHDDTDDTDDTDADTGTPAPAGPVGER